MCTFSNIRHPLNYNSDVCKKPSLHSIPFIITITLILVVKSIIESLDSRHGWLLLLLWRGVVKGCVVKKRGHCNMTTFYCVPTAGIPVAEFHAPKPIGSISALNPIGHGSLHRLNSGYFCAYASLGPLLTLQRTNGSAFNCEKRSIGVS